MRKQSYGHETRASADEACYTVAACSSNRAMCIDELVGANDGVGRSRFDPELAHAGFAQRHARCIVAYAASRNVQWARSDIPGP